MPSKAELRRRVRALPGSGLPERERAGAAIAEAVSRLEAVRGASAVALFVGGEHEPDTTPLFEALAGRQRWLPVVTGPSSLGWSRVTSFDALVRSRLGLHEPSEIECTTLPPVQVVVVPGLAFDRTGGRLGRGRGYYDRALSEAGEAVRIGICQASYLLNEPIPMEAHDQRMDLVVTPEEVVTVR